jgi:hypothetical protein
LGRICSLPFPYKALICPFEILAEALILHVCGASVTQCFNDRAKPFLTIFVFSDCIPFLPGNHISSPARMPYLDRDLMSNVKGNMHGEVQLAFTSQLTSS